MNDASAPDPYLTLPLDGVRAIEASAGTGKTFTLATLVVRLVVERGLRIGQILAVTFTEAATQELRTRIRARLLLASHVLRVDPGSVLLRLDSGDHVELPNQLVVAQLGALSPVEELRRFGLAVVEKRGEA